MFHGIPTASGRVGLSKLPSSTAAMFSGNGQAGGQGERKLRPVTVDGGPATARATYFALGRWAATGHFFASSRPVGRRRRAPTVRLGAIAVHTCRSRFVLPFSRFPNSIHSIDLIQRPKQNQNLSFYLTHRAANPTIQPPSIITKPIFPSASDRSARLCNPGNACTCTRLSPSSIPC